MYFGALRIQFCGAAEHIKRFIIFLLAQSQLAHQCKAVRIVGFTSKRQIDVFLSFGEMALFKLNGGEIGQRGNVAFILSENILILFLGLAVLPGIEIPLRFSHERCTPGGQFRAFWAAFGAAAASCGSGVLKSASSSAV